MDDGLFNSLKEGDIGIADRAYNCFKALYRLSRIRILMLAKFRALRTESQNAILCTSTYGMVVICGIIATHQEKWQ